MKTEILIKEPELKIQSCDDGIWLHFKIGSKHASINLVNIFGKEGRIVDDTIIAWCKKYASVDSPAPASEVCVCGHKRDEHWPLGRSNSPQECDHTSCRCTKFTPRSCENCDLNQNGCVPTTDHVHPPCSFWKPKKKDINPVTEKRKQGHSTLVVDKETHEIKTVDLHPTEPKRSCENCGAKSPTECSGCVDMANHRPVIAPQPITEKQDDTVDRYMDFDDQLANHDERIKNLEQNKSELLPLLRIVAETVFAQTGNLVIKEELRRLGIIQKGE